MRRIDGRSTVPPMTLRRRRPLILASVVALAAFALLATTTLAAARSSSVRRSYAATSGSAVCVSMTCYTPQQLEVAYGVRPLLQRGIDGRGETVVLPELAETQLSPPQVTDLRRDFSAFDHLFHLPAPRLRVVSTFAGPKDPWLAYGEEVLDAEVVHTIAPRAALTIVLVKGTSLDSADQAVAASLAALRLGAAEGAASSPSARPARSAGNTASTTPSSPS
jgi:subtilase family serine protease